MQVWFVARLGPPTCNALKVASIEDERQSRKSGVWSSLKELRLLAVKEAAHDGEKVTVLNVLGDHLLSGGADGVSLLDGIHLASVLKFGTREHVWTHAQYLYSAATSTQRSSTCPFGDSILSRVKR
jgi:hypothetical protein